MPKRNGGRPVCCRPPVGGIIASLALAAGSSAFGQHDAHRNAVRQIARGNHDDAAKALRRVVETPSAVWSSHKGAFARAGDAVRREADAYGRFVLPETHFVLALLESDRGDAARSLEHARLAVREGLPFERLLAGPRSALAALHSSDEFKQWANEEPRMLIHGPMLGHVTTDAASFWIRTAREADVRIEVSREGEPGTVRSADGRTRAEADYTAVLRVDGLTPDSAHVYRLWVDGRPATIGGAAFRTYPPLGTRGRINVAFGACSGYVAENERMWTTIAARDPLAMLMLGDNVYIDDPEHALTQQYCYYRRQSRPEWRALTAGRGMYAIWDDHDFGDDDSHGGPAVDNPPWKRPVWEVFTQNWNNPAYGGGRDQPGCWFDFYIGDVHFIMLDGRMYRESSGRRGERVESPSMLGPVQLAWLKETLRRSTGTFKVLASPVPWAPGAKGGPPGAYDTWDGFSEERDEIFEFLRDRHISGVILLSGDRHRSDVRFIRRSGGYDLYDFLSAGLTNYHTHPIVPTPGLLFGYNEKNSFALLRFDTAAADPVVTFEIVSIDNESVWSMDLRLSDLKD